jgi:hypothetical protein
VLRCTYTVCPILSFSPLRHMPEGYLQISNKGLLMPEAAALFLLRMLSSEMWSPVFWYINMVVLEQCPTPPFSWNFYTLKLDDAPSAFTFLRTRLRELISQKTPIFNESFHSGTFYSMLHDRSFLRRRYINQTNLKMRNCLKTRKKATLTLSHSCFKIGVTKNKKLWINYQ